MTYSSDTDVTSDVIYVKFPSLGEVTAKLLYAEKQDRKGIDFAVLCMEISPNPNKILPLHVNLYSEYFTGEVRIAGIGSVYESFSTAATGFVESNMVNIEDGTDSFMHIQSENAVQKGYSGGPVFSTQANAVIGIQVMASQPWQFVENYNLYVAEHRTINAMTIEKMVKQYSPLKNHLIILKRAFSGFDMLKSIEIYREYKNSNNQHFNEETIDETILPMIEEQKIGHKMTCDLNQPILNAINKANTRNCFVLGEEGGSGKTMLLLKLFTSTLKKNTIRKIPIFIELRNLPEQTERYNVYNKPGMLFADYIASELYDSYTLINKTIASKNDLGEKIYCEFMNPSCCETSYVLLLDGLNEVSLVRRPEVCEEILFWARNPHIQLIVTSRYKEDLLVGVDEQTPYIGSFEDFFIQDRELEESKDTTNDFLFLVIQKLKNQVISDYLSNNGFNEKIINETMENKRLLEIIKIPMYLTIFARLYITKQELHKTTVNNKLMDICTRGELLHEFFGEKEIQLTRSVDVQKQKFDRKYYAEIRKKEFIFEKIIPYIAFHMAVKENYNIKKSDLIKLIDDLFTDENSIMIKRITLDNSYRTIYELHYDRSNLSANSNVDIRYSPAEAIILFISQEMHIMRKIRGNRDLQEMDAGVGDRNVAIYEFLHENLRDYFAARWMQEDVRCFLPLKANKVLSLAHRNIPKTVLEYFGDICREHESRPYYDNESKRWNIKHKSYISNLFGPLRGRHDEDAKVMVSNIVAVMQYSRKNDLSGSDFHDIDFSETWLGGIRFSRAYGDKYFSTIFDGATINASNLMRNGHDATVTCVRRDRNNPDIFYSADTTGCVIQWSCHKKTGTDICRLDDSIRDMLISFTNQNVIYIASEHIIYQLRISDNVISKIYETKVFICNLKSFGSNIMFKTDFNPIVWIKLIIDQNGKWIQLFEDDRSMIFWPVSHSCESRDGTWLITGGSSKTHRVKVFHKSEGGDWNLTPTQTVFLPYGNRMNCIELSDDENRVLLCVQNYLYEYSVKDGLLDSEIFRLNVKSELGFAAYWYNETGNCDGILYSDGAEIILLDKNYKTKMKLYGGNGFCHLASPFIVDCDYRFIWQSGLERSAREKYHLHMDNEIQEFDADTNICNRIFAIRNRVKLGYCLNDHKVRLFSQNLQSLDLENSLYENTSNENIQFLDYIEMKGSVSFSIQRIGQQIIVYDRYTGENDSFKAYLGLFIQGCSMKNLKGDMGEPDHREILRRYGAILEES